MNSSDPEFTNSLLSSFSELDRDIGNSQTKKIANFSAGPGVLPKAVLQQAQEECLNWGGLGISVMEMSHRSKHFAKIHA